MPILKPVISIDKTSKEPIYKQISIAIIKAIESGRFSAGTKLPGSRTMAEMLKVNRNTVVQAYEDLHAQGWIESSQGKSPLVSTNIERTNRKLPNSHKTKEKLKNISSIKKLKLSDGHPDSRLFPMEVFSRIFGRMARLYGHRLYSDDICPKGTLKLRSVIAEMLSLNRGIEANSDSVLITRGSQQAIYLLGIALKKLKLNNIILESPGYSPAANAFREAGLNIQGLAIDSEGFDVDGLENLLKNKVAVSAIYITPHHQYPTTITLKANRRIKLLDLAEKYNFWIIEDDYDHEFHYDSSPVLPLKSLRSQKVIYISSLSKVLSIGLRIGYVVASEEILNSMLEAKSLIDKIGDPLLEKAVAEFIEDGELNRHINKMRQIYKERRDTLWNELNPFFPELIKPQGGMAFWIPMDIKDYKVFAKLMKKSNIEIVAENQMAPFNEKVSGTRIGFAGIGTNERKILLQAIGKKISTNS